jgi:hypothetical protein
MESRPVFPHSVSQEQMKLALILNVTQKLVG